jgi:hypothetical protein
VKEASARLPKLKTRVPRAKRGSSPCYTWGKKLQLPRT